MLNSAQANTLSRLLTLLSLTVTGRLYKAIPQLTLSPLCFVTTTLTLSPQLSLIYIDGINSYLVSS